MRDHKHEKIKNKYVKKKIYKKRVSRRPRNWQHMGIFGFTLA